MVKRLLFGSLVSVGAAAVLMAVGAGRAEAQAVIGGRITGGPEQPLGGAVVVIRELALQAATGVGGTYSLTIAQERIHGQTVTMAVRFIGYKPETRRITLVRGPQVQDFQLAVDPLMLNDIVVTGTAEATSTKELSFSVGAISEAAIQDVPAVDPIRALQGKIAGVNIIAATGDPGAGTAVRLRGATTLTPGASQQPLLVVDGVITQGTLADLNAEDIERVEVVKGAAASSIYGSNAAAGVIQVFTRRGAQNAEGVTSVTVKNEYGQQGLGRRFPLNKSHYYTMNGDTVKLNASGNKIPLASHYMDQPYPKAAPFRDQQSDILGNGAYYTNYVAVGRRQGGTNLQASFENQVNDGIINFGTCSQATAAYPSICSHTDLGYQRRNVRMNMDQAISDRLDVSVGGFYSESHNRTLGTQGGGAFFDVLQMPPDVDLFHSVNKNNEPFKVDIGLDGVIGSSQTRNPLYTATHTHIDQDRTRVQGSARLRWRPTDWLSFESYFGYDRSGENDRNYVPKGTLASNATPAIGSLNITDLFDRSFNGGVSASLQRTFGQLEARLKVAGTIEDETTNNDGASGQGFSSLNVGELTNIGLQSSKQISSNQTISRARNVFAVAGITYKGRYIADALIRRDGSSLFGAGARYHTYYRYSGAYRLGEDLKIPGIQELKLRASIGTAGLRPPFAAQYETFTTSGGIITPGALGNRALKPAQSQEVELGLNLEFLDRFSLEVTRAKKTTSDQVLQVPLSSSAGFTSQWQNAGTLEGTTYEAAFGAVIANSRDLTWNVNVTFDRTRMRVTKLNVPAFTTGSNQQSQDVFLIKEGAIYGSMWGYRFARTRKELTDNPARWSGGKYGVGTMTLDTTLYSANEDGLMIQTSTHGTTNERALKYVDRTGSSYYQIGDANSNFSMSFSTTFNWRGFSVYGLLDWVNGGDIYNLPRQWVERQEFRSAEMDQASKVGKVTGWCRTYDPTNTSCSGEKAYDYYSAINDANTYNSWYVENGTYARLRELSVGYALNARTIGAIGLSRLVRSLRISVVGRNLLTWTKYSGLDPDTHNPIGLGGDPTTFRFDGFSYPNFRTYSGMVEIGF